MSEIWVYRGWETEGSGQHMEPECVGGSPASRGRRPGPNLPLAVAWSQISLFINLSLRCLILKSGRETKLTFLVLRCMFQKDNFAGVICMYDLFKFPYINMKNYYQSVVR